MVGRILYRQAMTEETERKNWRLKRKRKNQNRKRFNFHRIDQAETCCRRDFVPMEILIPLDY